MLIYAAVLLSDKLIGLKRVYRVPNYNITFAVAGVAPPLLLLPLLFDCFSHA